MAEAGVVVLYANPNVSNYFRLRAVAALHYLYTKHIIEHDNVSEICQATSLPHLNLKTLF
jgi:hypothetical protein